MYILGLNAFHGDSAACLFRDDELIMAIEEERLRRIKHWAGFPIEAIKACLKEAKIDISQVDYITISRDPSANLFNKIKHSFTKIFQLETLWDRIANLKKVSSVKTILAENLGVDVASIRAEIVNVEHHRSHLASAFFASNFDEAALLSVDGFGDFTSTMIGVGKGNSIEVFDSVIFPHSIGVIYTAFTQFLGFWGYGDEYKVMGLAPYGTPRYTERVEKVIFTTDDGLFKLDEKFIRNSSEGVAMTWENGNPEIGQIFSDKFVAEFGQPRQKDEPITEFHSDLAASIQAVTEKVIFHILNSLYERTKIDKICIAGGVAQNSVANGKIFENTPFKRVYIPSAATDAGTAIGSALYLYNHIQQNPRIEPILSADFGEHFTDEYIENLLNEKKMHYLKLGDYEINNAVTDCLVEGGVVGWFKGRSEFGPRALGYRSILVDPRRSDAKEILNLKIKRREPFRPFAPSILHGHEGEYFEQQNEAPFMEKVYKIRKEKQSVIPAVTHVDGTGRLQSVYKEVNPKYYEMIYSFFEKTGVPIVLNTSFNENEPIVNTPEEALACYQRTTMDMLVLENYLIKR